MIPMPLGFWCRAGTIGYLPGQTPILWVDFGDDAYNTIDGSGYYIDTTCKITGAIFQRTGASAPYQQTGTPFTAGKKWADFSYNVPSGSNNKKLNTSTPVALPIPFTAFMVVHFPSPGTWRHVGVHSTALAPSVATGQGNPQFFIYANTGSATGNQQIVYGSQYDNATSAPGTNTAVRSWKVPDTTPSNTSLWVGTTLQAQSATGGTYAGTLQALSIGGEDSTYLTWGGVPEIIVYGTALSDADRTTVTTALATKWLS